MDERVSEDQRSLIFQALGAVSMCWDPRPSDQVFDSTRARAIGDDLVLALESGVMPEWYQGWVQ